MKQIYPLILFLFLQILPCCRTENEDKNQLRTFDLKELPKVTTVKLSDLGFEDIEYIPLETNDISLISTTSNDIFFLKLVAGEKFYLIKRFNKILQFSDDGRFTASIGKTGRGPEEFTAAHDADVNEKDHEIYVLARWQKKFFIYSEKGKYLRMMPVTISANEFSFFDNGILCYGENHMGDIGDSYNAIGFDGIIRWNYRNKYPFKNHDAYGIEHENIFYHFNNQLFKKEVYSDTVYKFENLNFKPHLVIGVGEKLITPDARSQYDSRTLAKTFIIPLKLFEFGDYVFYEFVYRFIAPVDVLIYSFIGSKTTDFQALINAGDGFFNDLDGGPDFIPLTVKNDNSLIAWVDALQLKKHVSSEAFKNSKPRYPEKKKELVELADRLKETDNPVLMLVSLKK
jgi:hypothetical protein